MRSSTISGFGGRQNQTWWQMRETAEFQIPPCIGLSNKPCSQIMVVESIFMKFDKFFVLIATTQNEVGAPQPPRFFFVIFLVKL